MNRKRKFDPTHNLVNAGAPNVFNKLISEGRVLLAPKPPTSKSAQHVDLFGIQHKREVLKIKQAYDETRVKKHSSTVQKSTNPICATANNLCKSVQRIEQMYCNKENRCGSAEGSLNCISHNCEAADWDATSLADLPTSLVGDIIDVEIECATRKEAPLPEDLHDLVVNPGLLADFKSMNLRQFADMYCVDCF